MKLLNTIKSFYILVALTFLISCQKREDFLDKKPNSNLVIPSTLQDFQNLLDNNPQVLGVMYESPELDIISADEYYMAYTNWASLFLNKERLGYIWASDIYNGETKVADWDYPFQQIFYANIVLEGLQNIPTTQTNQIQKQNIEGSAYFMRANAYYNLAQIFVEPYDSSTASIDMGLPLKLTADINDVEKRSTVEKTYNQIIADLKSAAEKVPENFDPKLNGRPSKPAVFALLAKTFLAMRNYTMAGKYADSCLSIYNALMDFNILPASRKPFSPTNPEVLYQSGVSAEGDVHTSLVLRNGVSVDTNLYHLYSDSDLRKTLYYNKPTNPQQINSNLGYSQSYAWFKGLATDEVYLIRAECYIRAGDLNDGLNDLNHLLINRYRTGTYTFYSTNSFDEALDKVLEERRKELVFRGTRWTDLRRLNKEGRNITIQRILNGQSYLLLPNSPLYTLPIPQDEISISHIEQNPR